MERQNQPLNPEEDALKHIAACRDKPFLEERFIDSFKGRGVFTNKTIEPSTFVVEYRGNIFCQDKKKCCDTLNNFLYQFSWNEINWCIDASKEDKTLGRLVNDDHISPNCEKKKIVYEGKPHLCLFAVKEISPGEEITYSYGDSSYPWRAMESHGGSSASNTDIYATSSTPSNEQLEDSEASSSEQSDSDDDDGDYGDDDKLPDSGPRHDSDSFANINSQLDFREGSPFTQFESSHDTTGSFMLPLDDASCSQQDEDEAAFNFDEHYSERDYELDEADLNSGQNSSDEEWIPNEDTQKPQNPSYTSKNYCYICGKGISKFAGHLLRHADEDPDVAEAFALPKFSKERKRLLDNLRNRGNYKHNQEVLKNNSGELKLRRRLITMATNAKTHVHCLYCKGLFNRKNMWKHVSRCPSRKTPCLSRSSKTSVLSEIALAESRFSQKLPSGVWKILSTMKQDEISFIVQNDYLLIQLAKYLTEKYRNNRSKHEHIRQKLREMGRLLLALHEKSIFNFEDAIKPENFYKVVETVRDIAGFDEKKQCYEKPSLALKLGHSLKKMCRISLSGTDDDEQMRETKKFVEMCRKEWSKLVSQTAVASLSGRIVNSPSTIPFTRDMQTFYTYLETTSASATESLEMSESPQVYSALCRVTLAQVSVLNKGAPEVSKMTLKSFQERDDATKVLSKHFIRINIQSKRSQCVAVLLTSDLVGALTLLISKRTACGVHKDNPFLFAKPDTSTSSLYHGGNCIRAFSSLCRAKNPEHLRSVHLQKHSARVFQILNLENDELDHLAKLLGHDIRADRDYYRLPEAAVELAKIAKLLLAMEKGSLEKFKGNSLDEIEIEDELEPDVEQGNRKNSDAEEDNEESDVLLQQNDDVERQGRKLSPEQDALEHIKACRDKPFLEEMFIDSFKGRGVFTQKSIESSNFVVEYRGNIFSQKETQKKKSGDTLNNYLFNFSWNGTNWHIDASAEDGSLGRLVNDDHLSPNCEIRKVIFEGKPHLCLFAVKKISQGEEITYNYGDDSYPWRCTVEGSAGACSSAESCSDDEYGPSSDNHLTENNNQQRQTLKANPDERQRFVLYEDDSSVQQEDDVGSSLDDSASDEEAKDTFCTRKNYCYVCGRPQSKISRHLLTHRHDEAEIAEVFALQQNSKERKKLLQKLRNRGNFKHNQEVMKTRRGELKVNRRTSNMSTTPKTFAPCIYCKGMYGRKEIWRHMKRCPSKMSTPVTGSKTKILTLVAGTLSADPHEIPPDVRELLENLKKDEVSFVVWEDPYILQLAQCLCHMKNKAKKSEVIKQSLRQMGRLLLTLRKKSISSFEEAIKLENFSKFVEAVRELTGFNEQTKSYDRPSLMLKLGNSLKKIGEIKYARALKEDADKETISEAETFMKLCAEEWGHGSSAKSKSLPTIPFTQDVQLFYQCMGKTAASAVKSLAMYESSPVYNALLRVTVAQVLILNRNVFEVSKVTFKSFQERDETELPEDAAVCQSQLEQILSKRYVTINVMSKSDKKNCEKKVAVTLTPELLTAINLLVDKREACGVHKCNPFLFARPVAICTSFYQGQTCINTFAARCGAKNPENLRSAFFRKHIARIFHILSLTNDELEQLAKVLGRDIRTDSEHYQTPEAVADIAKISELLSAMENGSLERFEGKSFEEIEIPDEVQPYVELDDSDDDEEDNEDAEISLQLSDSFSSTKKRVSSSKKHGRCGKKKSENEESENNDDANTENDVKTPEETPSQSNDMTNIGFSDDDDDMNVDFDMDIDTDEDISDGDGDSIGSAAMSVTTHVKDKVIGDGKKKGSSLKMHNTDAGGEETEAIDTENHVEKKDGENENKNRLLAAVAGMKELRILIPKLNMNLQASVHISQLSSVCDKWPMKSQPVRDESSQRKTSSKSTNVRNKDVHMTCSHCKKIMMIGQTAYQKKGFTDVFCSKNCLFEMFPVNKPSAKICYYCHKAITQPLDLIMAVVDSKGTMKDFCNLTCVTSFKSNSVSSQTPRPLCSMCNKSCTTICELTLNETVHKFCSNSCLEDFCRDNMPICENCSSPCHNKPLLLKLKEDTKTICSRECLQEFKEEIKTLYQCTMCHTSRPLSDMIDEKTSEGMVELFCTRTCVTSYKLRPAIVYKLQGKRGSARLKKKKKDKQSKQKSDTEDVNVDSDSTLNEDADANEADESDNTPTLIIAHSCVLCCSCGKRLLRGQTLYQPKSSLEVFCSVPCLSERHPHIKVVTKKCYNCLQVIMRPHNLILAPVDDEGTMKELCSETCLTSVQSKRDMAAPKPPPLIGPRSECRMCARYCYCKFKLTLDGVVHKLCSDTCFINYHKVNNLPVNTCNICSSICPDRRFHLKMEDSSKTICSEECLVKCKEKVKTPRLCPMCQTSHQMSDMVENQNEEGRLDFFCSNRCMMVYKAQSSTASERNHPSSEESDIKDVKPPLPKLDSIKEEPIDEEYNQILPPSIPAEDIKDEPNVAKEELKIGSVFSLTVDSPPAAPTVTHMDLPASCSNCKRVLMDGETVYQRQGHTDIFCCTSCLLQFYQKKSVKTCNFCLQVITRSQKVLQAPVDTEGTMKDFCSQTCLSSFNYKKIMSTKIPILPVSPHSQCSICSRYCISKHEIVQQDVVHKICSDPCFLRFCNMNNLAICENCHSRCNTPLILKMEDCNKKLCSGECLAQFKRKIQTPQPCAMCHTSNLMSDMVENRNGEDVVELFCSGSCVMASKIQAVSAAGVPLNCDNCGKTTVPACHLAMSDASIRNFCTLTCAMAFKETQKDAPAASNLTGANDQTQCDLLKPPEKLPCAQCRRILKTTPKIVQKKNKMNFVCSLACSQEFKRVNNIMGKCEYCKYERIIRDAKRVDGKDCYFCSDGCKMLFRHELEQEWGKHCHSCAYCHSIARTVVTAKYEGKDEEFCSEDCNTNYNMLFCRVAQCDTCGHKGKLRQSLPMLGEVKHFCDLKCLLHFCNKKVQTVNTASSPPRPSGTAESSPVIANVISLASALARPTSTSFSPAQYGSNPDLQTKVIGHASIQTVPKELKNKSMICAPLVHNKGVSCTTQTVDTEAQTDNFLPKVIVLPLPVPVYVPLPMNMYSQYTPKPVGLPLPLPVPVVLPVMSDVPEPTMKAMREGIQPEPSEGKPSFRSEMETKQEDGKEVEHGQDAGEVTEEGDGGETQALKDDTSSCRHNLVKQDLGSFSCHQDLVSPPQPTPASPSAPEMTEDPQSLQSPESASPQSPQTLGKVHNKNKGSKLQQSSKADKEETDQRDFTKVVSRKHRKLQSQCGTEAWRRWVQWRESQTNMDPVSLDAVWLKEDVLHCSAAQLCDGLCRFINEVKRPDGEPYSPDNLFYLCLSLQQYLFENGRLENIFSDMIYNKFSTEFTKILKPSVTASGYVHSRVEEEFLWDCKQLGAYSPIVLLNTLLFFCCKYFGFTTVEQHRQLSFAHVRRCTKTNLNNTETAVLRFYPPISTDDAEADTGGVPAKRRKKSQTKESFLEMMENTENPLRCPVRLYEFYLSKCSESVRQRSDLFCLCPEHHCVPSSPLWFSSTPLDDSTLEAMLVRILTVRQLQGEDPT